MLSLVLIGRSFGPTDLDCGPIWRKFNGMSPELLLIYCESLVQFIMTVVVVIAWSSRTVASLQYDHAGWLLAIGQQVGADGPDVVGRSSGCEDDQSCGPNRGQVVYRLMPRPVVSVLGELECWVTFSPRAQRWLHVVS